MYFKAKNDGRTGLFRHFPENLFPAARSALKIVLVGVAVSAASCFIAIANYLHKKADFRPFGGCFLKGIGVGASPVFGRLGGNGPCPRWPREALPGLPEGSAARHGTQENSFDRSRAYQRNRSEAGRGGEEWCRRCRYSG